MQRAIAFTPMETRRSVIVEVSMLADELGFYAVQLPEAWGLDSTVVLTEIALATTTIRPMASILSIWGRTPATIAMNAATLLDVSDGRYILGLGASTPALAEGFRNVEFAHPAARMERVRRLQCALVPCWSRRTCRERRNAGVGVRRFLPPAWCVAASTRDTSFVG